MNIEVVRNFLCFSFLFHFSILNFKLTYTFSRYSSLVHQHFKTIFCEIKYKFENDNGRSLKYFEKSPSLKFKEMFRSFQTIDIGSSKRFTCFTKK